MPAVAADAPLEPGGPPASVLVVPEIRDYQRLNAELTALLDAGSPRVLLAGAEGQRLLASGLSGPWRAVVEVEGRAGPELAAGLNAPDLTVVCRGPAADGAGSGLRGGRLIVLGDAGAGVGYAQRGGSIVVAGDCGPRAGLNQSGGVLVLLGRVDILGGERQSGGHLFVSSRSAGAHAGRGRRGGRFVEVAAFDALLGGRDPGAEEVLRAVLDDARPWLSG